MNPDGSPTNVGEVRQQAGAVATAIQVGDELQWSVDQEIGGEQHRSVTERLAHVSLWLAPGEPVRRRVAPPSGAPLKDVTGVVYYPDVSNNNWNNSVQAALDFLSQLAPEGFSGVVHKVSEGSYFQDPFWQPVQQWCAAHNLPCLGYHYVTTNDAGAQAATWNGNRGGPNAMFDFEANSGNMDNFWSVVNGFNAPPLNVNVSLGYIPQWYWNEVGSEVGSDGLSALAANGIALVSSAYPDGSGYASDIYTNAGGNGGEGWNPYGGGTPAAWQFTDRANIDGFVVDCNAFQGTAAQLAALFVQ